MKFFHVHGTQEIAKLKSTHNSEVTRKRTSSVVDTLPATQVEMNQHRHARENRQPQWQ
jgi:hypothetical protein